MKLTNQLELATEDLLRFTHELPRLLHRIESAMPGQPGAASYDAPVVGGHTTVKFCESHERDNCPCGESTTYPAVTDPTGEAAVTIADGHHPAAIDLGALNRRIRAVAQHADALIRIAETWKSRPPTDAERRDTDRLNAELREPGCEVHARAGLYAPRECVAEVVDGWVLPKPTALCSACRSRIKRTHRVPSADDVRLYEERGKWPLMLETAYNLKDVS